MRKVIVDGEKITDKETLHKTLKKDLKFPEYYGENLDALWDCITTDIELPIWIEWIHFESSKKSLGEYGEKTLEIFRLAEKFTEGKLKITIKEQ